MPFRPVRGATLPIAFSAAVAFAPLAARADSTPSAPPPTEIAIPTFQILSGAVIQVAALAGFVLMADRLEGAVGTGLGLAVLAAAPALEGLAVCGIGRLSSHYTGGCGAPILAGYVGMAAAIGIYFGAHEVLGGNDTLGFAAFAFGPAVLATYIWHHRKVPHAEASAFSSAAPLFEHSAFAPRAARERSNAAPAAVPPLFVARF
ncbi:MAG TPA: hypothetical protein VFH73_03850 [Polyangia bacterium]|jgi:hypothetical protein|nr:hypothetical protein [Polyangia bacterium]